MWKVSPSILDSFRAVQGKSIFEKTPSEFIRYLAGEFKGNEATEIGKKIHSYLETGKSDWLMEEEKKQLDELNKSLPFGVSELKIRAKLTPEITISVIADRLIGNEAHDFKTGKRFYGYDYYFHSTQWKAYLFAYDVDKFVYHHLKYLTKRPYNFEYTTFNFFRYERMHEDLIHDAEDLIEWTIRNNVDYYLKF